MAAFTGTPIFDSEQVADPSALWQSRPVNPNIVWAGTGESFIRSHISVGQGFINHGRRKTWSLMGLKRPADWPRRDRPGQSRHRSGMPRWATPTGRSRSAASSAPPTVEKPEQSALRR